MNQTLTPLQHLPLAYRCVVEMLQASGERNEARFNGLCDHFERAYGLQADETRDHCRASALAACKSKFYDWV